MSDPVLIALFANLAAVIVSIFTSLGNRKKLNEVHDATNGMKTALVEATRRAAFAAGGEQEKKSQTDKGNPPV